MSATSGSWVQTAQNLIRVGEISVRVGVLTAVVYGIYWSLKFALEYFAHPSGLPPRIFTEYIILAVIAFAGAAFALYTHEHYCRASRFRMAGLSSLVAAAVLLIPALIAGLLVLLGGLALYIGSEIFHVASMKIEPKE
ncbi:MAG: hypothetical protein QXT33_00860 [Thermofilum sp.]